MKSDTPTTTPSTSTVPPQLLPSAPSAGTATTDTSTTESPKAASSKDAPAKASGRTAKSATRSRGTRSRTKTGPRAKSTSRPVRLAPRALELEHEGAWYIIPAEALPQFLRFDAEALTAVRAMRAAGIAEDVIARSFPESPTFAATANAVPTGNISSAAPAAQPAPPPPAEEEIPPSKRPPCFGHHAHQRLDTHTKNVVCARCETIIIGNTGANPTPVTLGELTVYHRRTRENALR